MDIALCAMHLVTDQIGKPVQEAAGPYVGEGAIFWWDTQDSVVRRQVIPSSPTEARTILWHVNLQQVLTKARSRGLRQDQAEMVT